MGATTVGTDKLGREFVIRPLSTGDDDPLFRMYLSFEPKRGAQGLPPADHDRVARWLDTVIAAEGSHLVVLVEGRISGHGMILPFAPDAAELASFLHQTVRDAGIGTVLNRCLVDVGRALGMARLWLSVEPSNRRAIRSYEKVGFRPSRASVWSPELEMDLVL